VRINIANPVSYIVQKLLVSGKRKPSERAKDVLYIHDTLELFGASIPELRAAWFDQVRPQLVSRTEARVRHSVTRRARRLGAAWPATVREKGKRTRTIALAAGATTPRPPQVGSNPRQARVR
jgi:hypothetical protein